MHFSASRVEQEGKIERGVEKRTSAMFNLPSSLH